MNKNSEIQKLVDELSGDNGNGYGDPEARRGAELRLQSLLAEQQINTAKRLNRLTLFLVVVGFLNALILAIQVLKG